jgi:hypothetical protein
MKFRNHRYQSDFPTQVSSFAGQQRLTLTNVNKSGAHLVGKAKLVKDEMVRIKIIEQTFTAQVRWTKEGRAGVSFLPVLTQRTLEVIGQRVGVRTKERRFDSSTLRELR